MLTLSICHHAAPATLTHNYPSAPAGSQAKFPAHSGPYLVSINYFKCQPKLVVLRQLNLTLGTFGLGWDFNFKLQVHLISLRIVFSRIPLSQVWSKCQMSAVQFIKKLKGSHQSKTKSVFPHHKLFTAWCLSAHEIASRSSKQTAQF